MACQGRDLYIISNCNNKTIYSQFKITVELELEGTKFLVGIGECLISHTVPETKQNLTFQCRYDFNHYSK